MFCCVQLCNVQSLLLLLRSAKRLSFRVGLQGCSKNRYWGWSMRLVVFVACWTLQVMLPGLLVCYIPLVLASYSCVSQRLILALSAFTVLMPGPEPSA